MQNGVSLTGEIKTPLREWSSHKIYLCKKDAIPIQGLDVKISYHNKYSVVTRRLLTVYPRVSV